jgi:membrane protease subunit HflK
VSEQYPTNPPVRESSVTLRDTSQGPGADAAARMDPANQSLADALRITYRIVQFSMVTLLGLFLVSGFKTVNEGERGVRLLFGRQQATDLPPGAQWAWPSPIGDLIKVETGAVSHQINRAFFPYVQVGDENRPVDRLNERDRLDPSRDGSLLTADLNLAHSQWSVTYQRADLAKYVENIRPGEGGADERRLIQLVVERAIVRAAAETTIDDLLKQTRSDLGSIESVAMRLAQEMLDDFGAGIRIDQLTLNRKFPPVTLTDEFAKVANQTQAAGKAREEADRQRAEMLNEVAGAASAPLIERIDAYEEATELGDSAAQADILAQIDALLEGREVEIDGRSYGPGLATGEVAELLGEAASRRATIVSRAQSDLDVFRAKLAQFNANPRLMMSRNWAIAYDEFLAKPYVQSWILPPGSPAEFLLNEDPDVVDQRQKDAKEREAREAAERRMENLRRERFRTDEGIVVGEEL